jgi:uncharacterized damage-inducible protein DinB
MVDELRDPRRTRPEYVQDERPMLESWLEFHRVTLLMKCDGLHEAGLRARPIPTSVMSLHGLVRHMTEVERGWFRRVLAGESDTAPPLYAFEHDPDGDFEMPEDASWEDDLAAWQRECNLAREVAATRQLDDTCLRRGQPCSLRWIYVHMIEEYARHNGHADLIRELVDGSVGD